MLAHDVLSPAGSDAAAVATLWWVFLCVTTLTYLVVLAVFARALYRARHRGGISDGEARRSDGRARLVIGAAMAASTLVLVGLLTADLMAGRAVLGERDPPGEPLHVRITAQQFWWQLEYPDAAPSSQVLTANELVVPTGRPIELELRSRDVIHSFWLPAIAGKRDLIPGITNTLRFSVNEAGRYEGQCAEFCGYQHANMRTLLTALPPAEFEAWRARQLQPARAPQTAEHQHGQHVLETSSCVLCHTVQGTQASATVGPDLTHFGSRPYIAASPLMNSAANLAAWISDPQRIKPGTNMPATRLSPEDLSALVAYLGSLQ